MAGEVKRIGSVAVCLVSGMICLAACGAEEQKKTESAAGYDMREETINQKEMTDQEETMDQEETIDQEVPTEEKELTTFQASIPEGYRRVLDDIEGYMYAYYSENRDTYELSGIDPESDLAYQLQSGIDELCMGNKYIEGALFHNGYMLYDLDGNGVEELIISGDHAYFKDGIAALYTLDEGEAVFLAGGWSRSRYRISEDGTIYHEGSSGAADSCFGTYRLAENGRELETVDFYFSGGWEDPNWYHNTTGVSGDKKNSEIVDVNFDVIMEEFDRQSYMPLELTYFIEYETSGSLEDALAYAENMEGQISGQMETVSFEQQVELTQRIYLLWDDVLNCIWDYLKGNLDENTMRALTEEEIAWIANKETVMEETLTEDAVQLIKQNERAADMTKKRVYELYEYLE